MKNTSLFPFERNRYFYGKLLTVRDFELEQTYNINKRRLLNRVLYGAGVVCGMGVTVSDDSTLIIESGLALDYTGNELAIENALIRKLQMIDGYELLEGQKSAYLCMDFELVPTEPVKAVGADSGEASQFNCIDELAHLYFNAQKPDYAALLTARGCQNINVIYSSDDLDLIFYCPQSTYSGGEFNACVLVVANRNTPDISFSISGKSDFIETENGNFALTYKRSKTEKRCVSEVAFPLKAQAVSDVTSALFSGQAGLTVEVGDHTYKALIDLDCKLTILKDEAAQQEYAQKLDTLSNHMLSGDQPIYLAKLELVSSKGGAFVYSVTNLPFDQRVAVGGKGSGKGNSLELHVTSAVEELEYWQKPEVRASYNAAKERLHFDFSLPTPQAYDYGASHGTTVIPLSSGMRVNTRYISEEIAHGLGMGPVNVTVSVEFEDAGGENAQMFGNSEVFISKNTKKVIPWVETAVITYPERGTMRIGLWLHDNVEGNSMRVHYFAQKPERDTERFIQNKGAVSIQALPEVVRLSPRQQIRLKAVVFGSDDKSVVWEVRDPDGGAIDKNGIYQAPELKGTYEIIAKAGVRPEVFANIFAIVE